MAADRSAIDVSAPDHIRAACQARVGQFLDETWRLEALIGIGGTAAVYAASHRAGGMAAVKVLHEDFARVPEARERFIRESTIGARLDHPGVVQIKQTHVAADGVPWFAMELLIGEPVSELPRAMGGGVPVGQVLRIADDALAVLEVAHHAGVIHRDIKPENLFVTRAGQLKLLDFGTARLHEIEEVRMTRQGRVMGTPAFMSPEQAMGEWSRVDARTDIWCLGATIFWLLSGAYVHEERSVHAMLVAAATRPARSLARVQPEAPLELVALVDKALSFDQAHRFHDASDMRQHIRELMGTLGDGIVEAADSVTTTIYDPRPPTPAPHIRPGQVDRAGALPAVPRLDPMPPPAVAPPQAAPPQAAPPQAGPPQAAPPLTMPPQAMPPQAMPPQAAPPQATPPHAIPAQAGPHHAGLAPAGVDDIPAIPSPVPEISARSSRSTGQGAYVERDEARLDPEDMTPQALQAMQEVFRHVERALVTRGQYGVDHPATGRAWEKAFTEIASALIAHPDGLAWEVTPYAFVVGDTLIWEPNEPLDRIPWQLFADGVRALGFLRGIDEIQINDFLSLLLLNPAMDMAPEDDLVTLIWEADFSHVLIEVVDAFVQGDQEERERFERDRLASMEKLLAEYHNEVEVAWRHAGGIGGAGSGGGGQMALDGESLVRALGIRVEGDGDDPQALTAAALAVGQRTADALAAQLSPDPTSLRRRFVRVLARAFEVINQPEELKGIFGPLRMGVTRLTEIEPMASLCLVESLCDEMALEHKARGLRGPDRSTGITRALISPESLALILEAVAQEPPPEDAEHDHEGLETLLKRLAEEHVEVATAALRTLADTPVRRPLLRYLKGNAAGQEAALGALLEEADEGLGLSLVRLLGAIETTAARDAVARAAQNPHAVVRIEALGYLEGASSSKVRTEMRTLLEDPSPMVRMKALEAMARYKLRIAGPYLVLRVRSNAFDELEAGERKQCLTTLCALEPTRAEAVAIELLSARKLMASEKHERTREMAAEMLGYIGRTPGAINALTQASQGRWKNSQRVRESARVALEAIEKRRKQGQTPGPLGPQPTFTPLPLRSNKAEPPS